MDYRKAINYLSFIFMLLFASSILSCRKKKDNKNVVVTKEMLINHNKKLVGLETGVIKNYLEKEAIKMTESPTGLWYRFVVDSVGVEAEKGQVVHLDYKVYLLDGTLCYSSEISGVGRLVVGKNEIETGLEEAVMMASTGDSLQFIVPPYLAFGLTGDGNKIPGQSILKYEIKVLGIDKFE